MRLKNIVIIAIVFFCVTLPKMADAQQFSYIYIQGDKQTPFYVKLEGEMQPRYGKNYSIISQLAPGTVNLEILFQQNIYPPQHFAIKVPENGSRAFLLSKKGSSFSLYDVQQQFYIAAGNNGNDDHVPTYNPGDNYVATNSNVATTIQSNTTSANNYNNTYNQNATNAQTAAQQDNRIVSNTSTVTRQAQNKEPQFIDNVELNNERTVQTNTEPAEVNYPVERENDVAPAPKYATPRANSSLNSQCPEPIMDNVFQDIYSRMNSRTDKTRLKYLLGKMDNCFTTSQVRILAKGLSNDPERYAFLKQAYPRVTDQGNFASLENLLTTREWKDYFKLIMP